MVVVIIKIVEGKVKLSYVVVILERLLCMSLIIILIWFDDGFGKKW